MFAFNFTTSDLLKQGYLREPRRITSGHQILEVPHMALGFGGSKRIEWLVLKKEAPAASSERLG